MNRIELIGRLTKDPETGTTQGGTSRAAFTLAVDRRYTDKDGNKQADFIPCVAWKGTADFIGKHISKGKKVAVVGSLQSRQYTTQDGAKRTAFEVLIDEIEFVEPKNAPAAEPTVDYQPGQAEAGMTESDDDELPFD